MSDLLSHGVRKQTPPVYGELTDTYMVHLGYVWTLLGEVDRSCSREFRALKKIHLLLLKERSSLVIC